MAVQLPRLWDAYQTLDIMTRGRPPMKCVGKCVGGYKPGRRCNWDIKSDLAKVENLLQAMETRPPREALPFLEELASFSLCQEFHKRYQEQADRIIEEWTKAIHQALGQYNGSLQPEVRLQDPYQSGTEQLPVEVEYLQGVNESEWTASNLGANEWTEIQQSYQQMTAERDTLSRQAAELASKLREAEEHLTHLSQELDQSKRECTPLSKQVESLTTQLDSEARTSNKYRAETQTQHKLLSNIVEDFRSQLNHTQPYTTAVEDTRCRSQASN
jgi:DNA repair exonuclease SbcCD ATPase subunit